MAYELEHNPMVIKAKTTLTRTLRDTGHQLARMTIEEGRTTVETWNPSHAENGSKAVFNHGSEHGGGEWQIANSLRATILPEGTSGEVVENYREGRQPVVTQLHTFGEDMVKRGSFEAANGTYEVYLTTAPHLPGLNVMGPDGVAVQQSNYSYPQRTGFDFCATLNPGEPVSHTTLASVAYRTDGDPTEPSIETFLKLEHRALTLTGQQIAELNQAKGEKDGATYWPDHATLANMTALAGWSHGSNPDSWYMANLLEEFPERPAMVRNIDDDGRYVVTISSEDDCCVSGYTDYEALITHLVNEEKQLPLRVTRPNGGQLKRLAVDELHITHLDGSAETVPADLRGATDDTGAVVTVANIEIGVSLVMDGADRTTTVLSQHRLTSPVATALDDTRRQVVFHTREAHRYREIISDMFMFSQQADTTEAAPDSQYARELDGYRIHADFALDRIMHGDTRGAIEAALKKLADLAETLALSREAEPGRTYEGTSSTGRFTVSMAPAETEETR